MKSLVIILIFINILQAAKPNAQKTKRRFKENDDDRLKRQGDSKKTGGSSNSNTSSTSSSNSNTNSGITQDISQSGSSTSTSSTNSQTTQAQNVGGVTDGSQITPPANPSNDPFCIQTDDKGYCLVCQDGHWLDKSQDICVSFCIITNDNSQTHSCTTCPAGFHMTTRKRCVPYIPNCDTYNALTQISNTCQKCKASFFLSADSTECMPYIENCAYQSYDRCIQCMDTYITESYQGQLFCQPYTDITQCDLGYRLNPKTKKCDDLCMERAGGLCKYCVPPYILLGNPQECMDPKDNTQNDNYNLQSDIIIDNCLTYQNGQCIKCRNIAQDNTQTDTCNCPSNGYQPTCTNDILTKQLYAIINTGSACGRKIYGCNKQSQHEVCDQCCTGWVLSGDKASCCPNKSASDQVTEENQSLPAQTQTQNQTPTPSQQTQQVQDAPTLLKSSTTTTNTPSQQDPSQTGNTVQKPVTQTKRRQKNQGQQNSYKLSSKIRNSKQYLK